MGRQPSGSIVSERSPNQFSYKKALVTGGEGFIGSHLVRALALHGAHIKLLSHYKPYRERGPLSDIWGDVEHVEGDITDYQTVESAVSGCDVIFHLAALIGIPYSYSQPQAYTRVNVAGTQNLVHAAMRGDVARFVQTSTSEVYGTAQYVPIDETHPLVPQSPYSASKIGADAVALSYFHSFELPVVVLRPFNCFGVGQSLRAIIPTILSQCLSHSNSIQVGDLTTRRNFTYVTDTVKGFISAAIAPNAIGQTINLGSEATISVGDLISRCMRLTGVNKKIEQCDMRLRPPGSEVKELSCNSAKAKTLLTWTPDVSLDEGLLEVSGSLRGAGLLQSHYAV